MQQKQPEALLAGLSNGVCGIFVTYIVYEILGEKSEPLEEFLTCNTQYVAEFSKRK